MTFIYKKGQTLRLRSRRRLPSYVKVTGLTENSVEFTGRGLLYTVWRWCGEAVCWALSKVFRRKRSECSNGCDAEVLTSFGGTYHVGRRCTGCGAEWVEDWG